MTTIIDTHTHVVAADHERYPITPPPGLARMSWFDEHPVDAAGLLADMDKAGVYGAVLVQAKGAYAFDNSYAADARATDPARLTNASIIDMEAPDRIERLTYWATERGMLGTRLFNIPPASPPWMDDPATRAVLDRVRELDIRVNLCVLEDDLPLAGALADLAPDVTIALDHCGFADLSGTAPYPKAGALFALAPHANLRFKVTTTLLEPALHGGGDPRDLLEHLAEVFGIDRLLWGSDYPQHHREPYTDIVDLARYACSRLSEHEQAQFLGANALALYPELTP
ncbi:MAG TPA: amidohydrolase family protein [Acidimicrobiales bacterium]|nr:amidohydrolase family protein [Acidimicrobiales bacterium]